MAKKRKVGDNQMNNDQQLLIEKTGMINEAKLDSRHKRPGCLGQLKGVICEWKDPTRNDHYYTHNLWKRVFSLPWVTEAIKTHTLFGEADHPEDRLEASLMKAAVVLSDYEERPEHQDYVGTFDILDTPCGRIVKTLAEYGCELGVSSRGRGSLSKIDGRNTVDESTYTFGGFDIVALPAVKKARQTFIPESLQFNQSVRDGICRQINACQSIDELNIIKGMLNESVFSDLVENIDGKIRSLSEGIVEEVNLTDNTIIKGLTDDLRRAYDKIGELESKIQETDTISTDIEKNNSSATIERLKSELKPQPCLINKLQNKLENIRVVNTAESDDISDSAVDSNFLNDTLRENIKLSKTINELRTELNRKEEEIDSLITTNNQKVNELSETIEELQDTIKQRTCKLDEIETGYDKMSNTYRGIGTKFNSISNTNDIDSQLLNDTLQENIELSKSLNRLKAELDKKEEEINSMTIANSQEINKLSETIEELQDTIKRRTYRLNEVESDYDSISNNYEELEAKLNSMTESYNSTKQELSDITGKYDYALDKLDNIYSKYGDSNEDLEELTSKYESLQSFLDKSTSHLKELEDNLAEMTKKSETSDDLSKALADKLIEAENEINKVNDSLGFSKYRTVNSKLTEMNTKYLEVKNLLNNSYQESQSVISKMKLENTDLKEQVHILSSNYTELSEACDQLKESLEAKKQELDTVTEQFENKIDDIVEQHESKLNDTINSYEAKITSLHDDMDNLSKESEELTAQNEKLTNSLRVSEADVESLESHLDTIEDKYSKLIKHYESMKEENESLNSDNEELELKYEELNKTYQTLKEEYDSQSDDYDSFVESFEAKVQALDDSNFEAESMINSLTKQLEDTNHNERVLEEKLANQDEQINDLMQELEEAKSNYQEVYEKLQESEVDLDIATENLNQSFEDLDELENRYNKLKKLKDSITAKYEELKNQLEESDTEDIRYKYNLILSENGRLKKNYLKQQAVKVGVSYETLKSKLTKDSSLAEIDNLLEQIVKEKKISSKLSITNPVATDTDIIVRSNDKLNENLSSAKKTLLAMGVGSKK